MKMPRAKKSFGQNWLNDLTVVKKIIDAAEIKEGELVLEVGPGTGVLTQALVDAGARVTAIEADETLMEPLHEKFGDKIELIHGDALVTQPESLTSPYKLIANIPYNITSDLLHHFLTSETPPTRMILMVQREVAVRITAKPPDMSLLSVVCQLYARCKRVTNVPAGAFRPIPKVRSAVVRLDLMKGSGQEEVIQVAKLGFSSKRKQLQKNLSSLPGIESDDVKNWLTELDLDPQSRAEVLSVDDWIKLTHKMKKNA